MVLFLVALLPTSSSSSCHEKRHPELRGCIKNDEMVLDLLNSLQGLPMSLDILQNDEMVLDLGHMHTGYTRACQGGIKVMKTSSKSADLREEMCVSVCNELWIMDQSLPQGELRGSNPPADDLCLLQHVGTGGSCPVPLPTLHC